MLPVTTPVTSFSRTRAAAAPTEIKAVRCCPVIALHPLRRLALTRVGLFTLVGAVVFVFAVMFDMSIDVLEVDRC
jgi:hypothetical protein